MMGDPDHERKVDNPESEENHLPTVAYAYGDGVEYYPRRIRDDGDELVRRSDVLEKISDHIDECDRQIQLIENNELDLENPEEVKQFWKEHKSLLQGMFEDFSSDNEKKGGDSSE